MKKVLLFLALTLPIQGNAYYIGGAYAQLVSCDWGQYGYSYGYIGTYNVNGVYHRVYFGNVWCPW